MSDDMRVLDRVEAVFDEGALVADAGLLAVGTLAGRLGLEGLIDETVRPPAAGRGSGAKVLTAVCSMLVGGSFFSDADRLRAGSAAAVVGFVPVAPSTLGTFLRPFTWGHVRQMDRAQELASGRAWAAGGGPDHHRRRFHGRAGAQRRQGRRRLGARRAAGISPAGRVTRRHRRDRACPDAQGLLPAGPRQLLPKIRRCPRPSASKSSIASAVKRPTSSRTVTGASPIRFGGSADERRELP